MSESPSMNDSERRQYFRIDDTVRVSLRRVTREEVESSFERMNETNENSFTVMASMAAITSQMTIHLRRIENEMPDVAAYLKGLDRKLEVLGRSLIAQNSTFVSEHGQGVNLSAGGMCLDVGEGYDVHTKVEIRMLLFPSFTGVLTYGEVVDCRELAESQRITDGTHRIRIEFTHIREQDRDTLIRHILRRQGDELRARRKDLE